MHFNFLVAPLLYGSVVSALAPSAIEPGGIYLTTSKDLTQQTVRTILDNLEKNHGSSALEAVVALKKPEGDYVDVAIISPYLRQNSHGSVVPVAKYGIHDKTAKPSYILLCPTKATVGGLEELPNTSGLHGVTMPRSQSASLIHDIEDYQKRIRARFSL